MKLFGHELGHKNQKLTEELTPVQNPAADRAAEAASEEAFERMEHPKSLGEVTIRGAVRAGEDNVVALPTSESGEVAPSETSPTPTDHQLTA